MGVAIVLAMSGFTFAQSNDDANRQGNSQRSDRSSASDNADQSRRQSDETRSYDNRRDQDRQSADERSRRDRDSSDDRSDRRSTNRDNEDAGLGVGITEAGRDGVRVTYVYPNSPAEEMGIQQGDRITHVNGQRVESVRSFISEVRNSNPGDDIEIEVRRDGSDRELSGELETRRETLRQRDGNRQRSDTRSQTFYGTPRGSISYDQGRSGRSDRDLISRLDSIQRQLDRLSREVDNLRSRVDNRQSRESSERTASYEEDQIRRDGRNYSARWSDEQNRSEANRQGSYFGRRNEYQPGVNPNQESMGGDVAGARTRPGEDRLP